MLFFEETINHLFFECLTRRNIWQQVLDWLQITHDLEKWEEELKWIVNSSKGKGWKVQLLKSAAAETVHAIWKYRNDVYFRKTVSNTNIAEDIINTIVYRGWSSPKIREHITHLMLV